MTRYPGPKSRRMIRELGRYVLTSAEPFVLDLERCRGLWLATVDGQRIFDWGCYYGSKLLSHNHPGLREAAYLKRLALAANNKVCNPDFLTGECLDYYRLIRVPADVYQVSYVPFKLVPGEALLVVLGALVVCFVATIYPARGAARLDPAEALRYE